MPEVINPWTRNVQYRYDHAERSDIQNALHNFEVKRALRESVPEFERVAMLRSFANLVESQAEQLAASIICETGKILRDARAEIVRTTTTLRASADALTALSGQVLDSDVYGPARGRIGMVDYFPLGTIAAITPYNFPLNLAAHKIGPALAVGDAVYWKPHPQCWQTSQMFMSLLKQAGFDDTWIACGVVKDEDFAWFNSHPEIALISFTGGINTGHIVASQAAGKRCLLELGGNDPLIVTSDADLDIVVETIAAQRFLSGGQRCTASKRIYIHHSLAEDLKNRLIARIEKVRVGDPSLETTDIGPLVSEQACEAVAKGIEECVRSGAIP